MQVCQSQVCRSIETRQPWRSAVETRQPWRSAVETRQPWRSAVEAEVLTLFRLYSLLQRGGGEGRRKGRREGAREKDRQTGTDNKAADAFPLDQRGGQQQARTQSNKPVAWWGRCCWGDMEQRGWEAASCM